MPRILAAILRPIAAIASGLGMALLFPPHSLGKLVWLVLIPLLAALWSLGDKRRKWKAFGLGYLTGISFFLMNLVWLRTVSDAGWIALSVYLALFPALFSLFAATWGNPWRKGQDEGLFHAPLHAMACALVWTGLEWLRSWLFTGFGWNPLGVAFHETPVFAQAADLLGATGLSILPIFVQGTLLQLFVRRSSQYHSAEVRRRVGMGSVLLLMAACYAYGVWRISTVTKGESIRLKALLVQLNIPQQAGQQEWSDVEVHMGYEDETLKALEAPHAPQPDWVLWPETALTGRILCMEDAKLLMALNNVDTIERVRGERPFTLIMGLTEREGVMEEDIPDIKQGGRGWNSIAIVPPDDHYQTARKHHLVIFGEYIPFVESLPFLAKIYEEQTGTPFGQGFSKGDSFEPILVSVKGKPVGIIPAVCFEDTVPRLLRKFTREGPQIIVNLTNDGWFKESEGAEQQFANARFRAIELRRPLIRSTNTGVTAAISPTGITLHPQTGKPQELRDENGSTFTRGSLMVDVDIPVNPPRTLYAMIGDWGVMGLALLGFIGMGWKSRSGKADTTEEEAVSE